MKIGFFTDTYYPTPDGVSHYLRDTKRALEDRGHEVFVFSLSGDRHEKNVFISQSVPIFVYPQYRWPLALYPFLLFRKLNSLELDVVHIHSSFFMGSIGYHTARKKNIPVVATFHTDFIRMQESIKLPFKSQLFDLSWRYNVYLYDKCDMVTAPSQSAVEFLKENGIRNAIELPLFVRTDRYKPGKSRENKFVVQYIGRITKDKGIYNILDVANEFPRNNGVRFVISGTGPEEDKIRKMISKMDLEDLVQMTGYIGEQEKLSALSNASVFVHPSETDTFGIAVLEAMACGKPAIVSNKFPLINTNSPENGMIGVDFSKPKEVAEKIRELKSNNNKHTELCESARKYISGRYDPHTHVEMLENHYKSLIELKKSS
ncbi:MAG: glycosyltransferase [Thermoplasmataceae archaeon]